MRYLAFDLETDGLLRTCSKVHMAILTDLETLETYGFTDEPERLGGLWTDDTDVPEPAGSVNDALTLLSQADILVSFNGWAFDMLVLEKLYPGWDYKGYHLDLMVHGTCIRPYDKLKAFDAKLIKQNRLPPRLLGSESLRAWAIRAKLDQQKDEYSGSWESLNPEMWRYGLQDGRTTAELYHWMMQERFRIPWQTMWIEQEVGRIIGRQMANGWRVDLEALKDLDMQVSQEIVTAEQAMTASFGSWYRPAVAKTDSYLFRNPKGRYKAWLKKQAPAQLLEDERYQSWPVKVPKRTMTRQGRQYVEGAPFTPIELHRFNPGSRADVYRGLNRKYGWEPTKRTPTGDPQVSEETLAGLEWPEAKAAHRYYLLKKIGDYTTSWLKRQEGGRLYGRVNPNRANTRRMTHNNPNLANVPAKGALFGEECRAVFVADKGWVQVGADAEQLELRCLANRLAPYDQGAYAEELISGDAHTLHISAAADIPRAEVTPDIRKGGKGVTYCFIYGGGDAKLGASLKAISGLKPIPGKQIRENYERGITGLKKLLNHLQSRIKADGYIKALDGGRLYSRSSHSVLNLQLQSDGALLIKVGLVFADQLLSEKGLTEGRDFKYIGVIHDEVQTTAKCEHAVTVGEALVRGMEMAGEWFRFPLPTTGEYKIGNNWSETH
jgi:DNA polymerase I-like protein with 3'-5' exonuclease and polymerase domains